MKVGFITIIGKPNAGKSTLVNSMVGEKVSITSWKPQTTRNMISGIITTPEYQLVLIDTPGLHNAQSALSKFMMESVSVATKEVDLIIYVANGAKPINSEEIKTITEYVTRGKVIIALNKVDEAEDEYFAENYAILAKIPGILTIVPISALRRRNLDVLLNVILENTTEGTPFYDEDAYTDKSINFMVSEIVREKALKNLSQELPYGIGVSVIKFEEREDSSIIDICVEIFCEKQAHKSIILGKGGSMIKIIMQEAREDIEKLLGNKVFITSWVKVKPNWRESELMLNELGYNKKLLRK